MPASWSWDLGVGPTLGGVADKQEHVPQWKMFHSIENDRSKILKEKRNYLRCEIGGNK